MLTEFVQTPQQQQHQLRLHDSRHLLANLDLNLVVLAGCCVPDVMRIRALLLTATDHAADRHNKSLMRFPTHCAIMEIWIFIPNNRNICHICQDCANNLLLQLVLRCSCCSFRVCHLLRFCSFCTQRTEKRKDPVPPANCEPLRTTHVDSL